MEAAIDSYSSIVPPDKQNFEVTEIPLNFSVCVCVRARPHAHTGLFQAKVNIYNLQ